MNPEEIREIIAVALANGGSVEDEYDAAAEVIDALRRDGYTIVREMEG